jgi:Pentapeptide repeats (9 copies)
MPKAKRPIGARGQRSRLPTVPLTEGGRLDLTYRRLADVNIADKSLELSLFTGAILERCRFSKVSFDRCDFAGTKFIDCTFTQCSFVPVEVRSCFFKWCKFNLCDIRGSQWASTQVEDTIFETCDFREATIRETVFSNTKVRRCNFTRDSITLDRFSRCSFQQVDFGDCTALFLFFDNCRFSECRFSTECIGYTYGLSIENLRSFELTYLGEPQEKPTSEDLVAALLTNYSERRWFVGVCALELNFRRQSPALSLRGLVSRLEPEAAVNKRVDWDELQFLSLILQRLRSENRLPLVGLWPLYKFVQSSHETLQREFPASRSFVSAPELVISRLQNLLNDTIEDIRQFADIEIPSNMWIQAELHFKNRPQTAINQLVPRQILPVYGATQAEFSLKAAQRGSWIEVWQLALAGLVAVQVSLVAVNGIMGQILKLTKKIRSLSISARKRKAVRKPLVRRSKRAKLERAETHLMRSMLVATLSDEKSVLLKRAVNISDEALRRLDRTLVIMLTLPDEDLGKFDDYSDNNLQIIQLKQVTRPDPAHRD